MGNEKLWIDRPSSLMESADIFPRNGMTEICKINCLVRLLIVIVIILLLLKIKEWIVVLLTGFALLLLISLPLSKDKPKVHGQWEKIDDVTYSFVS